MSISIFSYSVQRAYPYKWFTPVTILGGVVLAVVFSIMNFVNNSYILESQDHRNPNATISRGAWFSNWPSYLTRSVQPICQPQQFSINSQFFTNQTGFEYTLLYIGNHNQSSIAVPSLPYFNNVLEDCAVTEIQLQFEKNGHGTSSWLTPWGITLQALSKCRISTAAGNAQVYLSATYNPISSNWLPGSSTLIATDPENRAALFWAQELLIGFWYRVAASLPDLFADRDNSIISGLVTWNHLPGRDNITSNDSFFRYYSLSTKAGVPYSGTGSMENFLHSRTAASKEALTYMDLLIKAMYSAILADLGQTSSTPESSFFTMGTAAIKDLLSKSGIGLSTELIGVPIQLRKALIRIMETSDSDTLQRHPPVLTPSVISTSYRCQVPKLKSGGEIFISILVADLVLLSAAWRLFTFGVGLLALNKAPQAHYCEGCLKTKPCDDEMMEKNYKIARVSILSIIDSDSHSNTSRNDSQEYNPLRSQDDSETATLNPGRREGRLGLAQPG